MHDAKTSAAVPWWGVNAQLYEQQILVGVFAMSQGFCQPGLHSSTEEQGMRCANTSAAVHWWLVTTQLYEQQILVGVFVHLWRFALHAGVQ